MRTPLRRRWWLLAAAVPLLGVALLIVGRRGEPDRQTVEVVRVERGEVAQVQRELGVLAPRDPVIAKSPFNARLQWVIEDGTWVEAGAELFILSDEDEIKRVAELRAQLVQGRAELRLAKLKRAHGEAMERPKLAAAERAYALAQVRRKLVESTPVGGLELVRLAEALRPLDTATRAARREAENTQDAWQAALDTYLEALDAWQAGRDRILRGQAKLDELESGSDAQAADPAKAKLEREAQIAEVSKAIAAERLRAPALAESLNQARTIRDRLQQPRDAAAAALAIAEAAEADLRLRAEIEKLGLPRTRLQLDERKAAVDLAETRRLVVQTKSAVEAGSLARSELERLTDQLAKQENALEVVRTRLAIALRPPDAKVLAEADAVLLQARIAAEDATSAYDRAIAMLDQDLALKQLQVERTAGQIDVRSAGFPAVIEAGIRFAERELALLGPEEADDRTAVETQLATLHAQQTAAAGALPNVVKAPVAGLVRVMRNGDRAHQAGDQAWELDAMVEIFPPENMDVLLRVNEVDLRHLRLGQVAGVVIPALKDRAMRGEVVQIAGVGRDKFSRPEYAGKAGFADVVDFEARVRLAETAGVELRQGMAARVEIVLDRAEAVLRLPQAAVQALPEGAWQVRRCDGRLQRIDGRVQGPLWFIVTGGLVEGDEVGIVRTRNR
jgi:hypothetical protein